MNAGISWTWEFNLLAPQSFVIRLDKYKFLICFVLSPPLSVPGRQDDDGRSANICHLLAAISYLLYRRVVRSGAH